MFFEGYYEYFLVYQQFVGIYEFEFWGILIQCGFNLKCFFMQLMFVGLGRFELLINVFGVQDFIGFGIDGQYLVWVNMVFGYYVVWLVIVGVNFGSQGDEIIFGDNLLCRMQIVLVQYIYGIVVIG